jgi:predicted ArsR family transcriptional regulator
MTVADFQSALGVTATAVRQRLNRLLAQGYLQREAEESGGRGRPGHRYQLTEAGRRHAGVNFTDLAVALWQEVRAVPDAQLQRGLLRRIADRMTDHYRDQLQGETLPERMDSLAELFQQRQIPVEVQQTGGELPVLSVLACPYPDLADQDQAVCAMERLVIADLLDHPVTLDQCRLSGASCCTFQPREEVSAATENSVPG